MGAELTGIEEPLGGGRDEILATMQGGELQVT